MVPQKGLELLTLRLKGVCSIQLSYTHHKTHMLSSYLFSRIWFRRFHQPRLGRHFFNLKWEVERTYMAARLGIEPRLPLLAGRISNPLGYLYPTTPYK